MARKTRNRNKEPDPEADAANLSEGHASQEDESSSSSSEDVEKPSHKFGDDSSNGDSDASDDDQQRQESSDDDDDQQRQESSDDDGGGDDADAEQIAAANALQVQQPASATGEQCTFDLRNLLAINSHQIHTPSLYSKKKQSAANEKLTIPPTEAMTVTVNDDYLLEKATDGCTQLVAALWQLPKEKSDAGPMAFLPSFEESKIPRALPPPPPKQETKWEKFAKEKGIPLNKNKRSRKVWDETTGTWMYRHGYEKANDSDKKKEWPIMEVKGNDDPYADPWEKQREAKRARTDKNTESRMRNQERAGVLAKGTTTRVMKNRERVRQAGKAGGNADRDLKIPVGVPVDLKATKGSTEPMSSAKRGKASTVAALTAVQRSTASLGKFDKMREGEPERKKSIAALKKRKYESATDRKVISTEAERGLKVLRSVLEGGGVAKEKLRKKGKLAKGETAYEYDYDDGLGPSSFRKKKGRAGAGKMKKMTKKRVK